MEKLGGLEKFHHFMGVVGVADHLGEATILLGEVCHPLKMFTGMTPTYLLEKVIGFVGTPLVEI